MNYYLNMIMAIIVTVSFEFKLLTGYIHLLLKSTIQYLFAFNKYNICLLSRKTYLHRSAEWDTNYIVGCV